MVSTTGAIAPARVLELGRGMATTWAGRLLADLGADVLKIEPRDGDALRHRGPFSSTVDPDRSALFVAANLNKRGMTLDLPGAPGHTGPGHEGSPHSHPHFAGSHFAGSHFADTHPTRSDPALAHLAHLLDWAEIVLVDYAPDEAAALGLDPGSCAERHAGLVVVSITPFGVYGPRSNYQATELTVAHGGGWANLCPNTHTDPELAPLKPFGEQSAFLAGTCAAMTALALWREARRSGVGEFVDLAQQAYVASVLEAGIPTLAYREFVTRRYHPRGLIPWGIFQAKDAPVFLVCIEQDQWERLVDFMGNPDWAVLEVFADAAGRRDNQDLLHSLLQEFVAEWSAQDLYHALQAQRVCVAPVLDYAGLASDAHLAARNFFQPYADASGNKLLLMANPILRSNGRAPIRRPAPRLHEPEAPDANEFPPRPPPAAAGAPRLPLEGIRVIDLGWAWAGPFCALSLANLGADVIRVESAQRPDLYRRLPIHPDECAPTLNTSGMFNQWHQGKRSVAIALRTPEGLALLHDLIRSADVVVQNFGTGVLERMGLGYDTLRQLNPGIVLASVSGYGQTGPYRGYIGYGPSAAALSGLCSVTGYEGGGPEELGLSMPDPSSGLTAALGVVDALIRRDATGIGDHIDVSLWEATAVHGLEAWLEQQLTGTQPARIGNRDPKMAPHGCYRCLAEDEWVTIACRSDAEWQRLAHHVDPALAGDERLRTVAGRKRHEDELDARLTAWTIECGRWVVTRELQALGIPAFPSLSTRDIVDDPHLNARGFIERRMHPEVGVRPHTGIPWRLDRRRNGVRGAAPCLGADTDAVLREVLGLDDARIAALRCAGTLE